jgi:hypothetical protein
MKKLLDEIMVVEGRLFHKDNSWFRLNPRESLYFIRECGRLLRSARNDGHVAAFTMEDCFASLAIFDYRPCKTQVQVKHWK